MKNITVAAALGAGYLLGRSHKTKLALALAGVAAGKRLKAGAGPTGHAGELLKSSPVEELIESLRGELVEAGKKAAVAAASKRVDSLSDRLQQRADSLRTTAAPDEQQGEYEEHEGEPEGKEEEEGAEQAPESRGAEPQAGAPGSRPARTAERRKAATRRTQGRAATHTAGGRGHG